MTILFFLLVLTAAGLGGYALLVRVGLDDLEAWAGGRVAGLVLVAMPAWWAGVVGVHQWRGVGTVVLVVCAVVGGVVAWRRRAWRQLLVAEAIFWTAIVAVIVIRLDHPQIVLTEKPMDMGILASLLRAEGFPPPDMWLAGEALPYYYWGALLWTVPLSIASLPLEIGYNLIVGLIGGMVVSLLWMLGRRAGGSHWSGLLVAFFGLFAGTPDGLRQLFAGASITRLDYWHSSRQIADTITEFPLFTFWLGDLHPHLLSMPIICLALLVAWQAGRDGPKILQTIVLTVLFGVAWSANPWSMPPTVVGIALLLLAGPDQWHWPGGDGTRRWLAVAAIAVGGWLVTAPFHLDFQPFFQGVRMVFAWTPLGSLLLYAGCLLIPAALASLALLQRFVGGDEEANRAIVLLATAAVLVVAAATGRPTLVILVAICVPFVIAVLGPRSGEDRPVFALAALGIFLFLVPEIVYVADSYGDDLHRMNTVFKSYIQAWIFVAVALPVLLRWGLKRRGARLAVVAVMILVALPHVTGMFSQQIVAEERGVDGMRWMTAGDRAIVHYLRQQPPGTIIAEAVGGAYTEYARLSSASGVPAYLGWANHESVWRGNEVLPETERRGKLITRLYTSGDAEEIRRTVEEAGIHLAAIGSLESKDFSEQQLAEVAAAGEVVLDEDGGQVVRFASPIDDRSAAGPDMMEP
jgi:YYY domain-containing protein